MPTTACAQSRLNPNPATFVPLCGYISQPTLVAPFAIRERMATLSSVSFRSNPLRKQLDTPPAAGIASAIVCPKCLSTWYFASQTEALSAQVQHEHPTTLFRYEFVPTRALPFGHMLREHSGSRSSRSKATTSSTAKRLHRRKECAVACIIDFYFRARYSPKQTKDRGKLIEVPVRSAKRHA